MQDLNTQNIKGRGPFATAGVMLNTLSTAAIVADDIVRTSGETITGTLKGVSSVVVAGNSALDIVLSGALEDMKMDALVDAAHRQVRLALAKAEVARILATIETPVEA